MEIWLLCVSLVISLSLPSFRRHRSYTASGEQATVNIQELQTESCKYPDEREGTSSHGKPRQTLWAWQERSNEKRGAVRLPSVRAERWVRAISRENSMENF